jgi:hypothetical protein
MPSIALSLVHSAPTASIASDRGSPEYARLLEMWRGKRSRRDPRAYLPVYWPPSWHLLGVANDGTVVGVEVGMGVVMTLNSSDAELDEIVVKFRHARRPPTDVVLHALRRLQGVDGWEAAPSEEPLALVFCGEPRR